METKTLTQKGASLRQLILRYLDDNVLGKPEESRTSLEEFLVENGRSFADALLRYERANPSSVERFEEIKEAVEQQKSRPQVVGVLRTYNRINAEEARRNADVEALETFRDSSGFGDAGDR